MYNNNNNNNKDKDINQCTIPTEPTNPNQCTISSEPTKLNQCTAWTREKDDLLTPCVVLISRYLNNKGLKLGNSIRLLARTLYHRYCLSREELTSIIFDTFQRRKRHLKYDPERSTLESYVAWFIYYSLQTILRQYSQSNTITLSELGRGEEFKKQGISTDFMERHGIEGLVNRETPEDLLIWKEFLQETYTFSGKHDCGVLMETNDRKTEALRLGLDYDTYRKRLLRKCSAFRPHLQSLGYFD